MLLASAPLIIGILVVVGILVTAAILVLASSGSPSPTSGFRPVHDEPPPPIIEPRPPSQAQARGGYFQGKRTTRPTVDWATGKPIHE